MQSVFEYVTINVTV